MANLPLFLQNFEKIVYVFKNYVDKYGKLCYNDYGAQEKA